MAQGKSLEQEVSTRRLGRSERSTRPDDGRIAYRVPAADANVNDFGPDAILARHSRGFWSEIAFQRL